MRGDISGRLEFGVALVRGLGGNLNETGREAFAKEIFKWCGESHPGRYVRLDVSFVDIEFLMMRKHSHIFS